MLLERLQLTRKEAELQKLGGSQTGKPAVGRKTNPRRKNLLPGVEAGRALVSRDPLVLSKTLAGRQGLGSGGVP